MKFEDMRVKEIKLAIRYSPDISHWVAKNRRTHIIGINLSGREYHDFGYQQLMLEGTGVFFFNARDDYTVRVLEKGFSYSVHFTTYEEIESDTFFVKTADVSALFHLLERIERQIALAGNSTHTLFSDFYKLCAGIEAVHQKSYVPTDPRMLRAEEYIKLHFQDKDCLATLYAGEKLSRRQFDELFKKRFDKTPSRYIILQRIEYAKQLLKMPHLSIMEVAERCGFSDVYYFSKVFKKEMGETPSSFRKE